MTAMSPLGVRSFVVSALIALLAVATTGCSSGPDDDVAESVGDVSSEPTETTTRTDMTSTTPVESSTTEAPDTPEAGAYVASFDPDGGSDLYRLVGDDVEPVTALSDSGGPVQLTDLALSSAGVLYGSTFGQLVRIDTASGDVEFVATFSQGPVNALTFLPDGRLVAADLEGRVSIVDVETGAPEALATYPAGLVSSGDLAVAAGGQLLATATDGVSEYLLTVDVGTGVVEILTASLPPAVYGLVLTSDDELLGLTFLSDSCVGGQVIVISIVDLDDVGYESRGCLDFTPGGAAGP